MKPPDIAQPTLTTCTARTLLMDLQLAEKWTYLILYGLIERTMRFNEIKRRVEGISQKVLTQCLRNLERNGMVQREVLPTSPVTVEYSVTELGASLAGPMNALSGWLMTYQTDIQQAQMKFDQRQVKKTPTLGAV
ncbi:winged helix-turn-helix transcriptional regulator [Duganella aceris]|uniref:Helix-turn-helix transcriptional regulator n=1 Tax=Duganella aceris TaxID=2703883 RepID=A0ABX0FV02_9BURK|nr:helix-turn-helix domain-containing protein [Duganella aceris]NGZ88542.1 helix-turn-helix transcriptional regulator [Duganella aceris]